MNIILKFYLVHSVFSAGIIQPYTARRNFVLVRAFALLSVDLGLFPCRVMPKDSEKWYLQLPCSALFKYERDGEQAGKFACCALGRAN